MSNNDRYHNMDFINEITNVACDDADRLFTALGIDVSRQGKKFAGTCPVHDGDNPAAFNFYPDGDTVRGIWFCRTQQCHDKHGKNLVSLIKAVKSKQYKKSFTWRAAVDWLVKFNGYSNVNEIKMPDEAELKKRKMNNVVRTLNIVPQQRNQGWSRGWVRGKLEIPAVYYQERGYSAGILDKYDVGLYKEQNRITVPVYDDNYHHCIGFTARSIFKEHSCGFYHKEGEACPSDGLARANSSKWRNSQDFESRNYLYNYWFARKSILDSGVAILVEGPGDVWRFEQNGIHNAIALFGTELREEQRVILDRSGALSLIIMTDNDEAGANAAKLLKEKLNRTYRLYFPKFKEHDVGDLNSDFITSDILPFIEKTKVVVGK